MSKTNTPAMPEKPEIFDVIVQRDHTHNGEPAKAGSTIKVTAQERAWLIAHRVVAADPAPVAETENTGGAQ